MGIDNNIQVDVYMSGQNTTSVSTDTASNVTVAMGQQDITVNKAAGTSVTVGQEGQEINIGMAGIQGPAGTSNLGFGEDGTIQYNRLGFQSGAETFLFFPSTDEVLMSGGAFTIQNGKFRITGSDIEVNKFIINDINNPSNNLLTIDPIAKKVSLTKNAAASEYYFGVAIEDPEERLHVGGNLKVEGDIYIKEDIIPLLSGVSNLGSPTKPFKELYIDGESINFVDANAKISATKEGFDFLVKEVQGNEVLIRKALTIVTGIDGGILKNVIGFAQAISGDASKLIGMHYTGILHNGVFIEQNIPQNSTSLIINYGETLPYTPKVLCSVVPNAGASELYFTNVENITTSSCKAIFSSKITENNYKINCFISPRDIS